MDVQLKELIEKIKTEGVNEADGKAKQIINDAERQASEIIDNAKKKSENMITKAKAEIEQFENSSKEAVKQAGRDLILNIKTVLTQIFDSIIKNESRKSFSEDVMKEIIPVIINGWNKDSSKGIDVLLSKEDCAKLEGALLSKLSEELKKGTEVKPHASVNAGFRISEKDGNSYYDFTDESIAENLMQHMNPVLAGIIKQSVGEQ